MTDHREVVSSLLSWIGQCHPHDYVRWLKETQPDVFAHWPEAAMRAKFEAVLREAWGSLADRAA